MTGARGRILLAPRVATAPATGERWRLAFLLLVLPLFGQTFQYVIDAPPLYVLSKAWPLISLPLALWGCLTPGPPYKPLLLCACAWMIAVTPAISLVTLGNDALGAAASTAKVWALTGALALPALLMLSQPSARQAERALLTLGAATFAIMLALWLLAPLEAYGRPMEETKIFLADPERGRRLNMPMLFGLIGLFALGRSLWRRPALWKLALLVAGFWLMLTLYKQRVPIAGAALGIVLGGVLSAGRWRGPALAIFAAVAIAAAVPLWAYLQSDTVTQSLGGSLSARQIELAAALDYLNAEPWRWLIGVGGATRVGGASLGDIVGTPFFFLSDLGWIGVLFEYGAIGGALILSLHLIAIGLAMRAAKVGGDAAGGLADYSLYMLIASPITSLVLAPGELAVCLSLSWWILVRTPAARSCAASGSGT